MAPYILRSAWDVYKVDMSELQKSVALLTNLISTIKQNTSLQSYTLREGGTVPLAQETLSQVLTTLDPLNVPVTKTTVSDAQAAILNSQITYSDCVKYLEDILSILERELRIAMVFAVDANRVRFYEQSEPLFGAVVASKFPSIAYDIDQAGKCFACDLTTASAFHTLRCLEAGTKAIARCLGIPDPANGADRNWGIFTGKIRDEIERRWPQKTGRLSGDAKLFDEAFGALKAIQNPYRNATMHLDSVYSSSEAKHLFEMVKGLMGQIASRMDENGDPKA